MKTQRISQLVFVALIVAFAALAAIGGVSAAPPAQITPTPTPTCPPGQFFDPVMNLCRPIQQPCPAGTIDLQGNGVNDGGDDCQPLDVLPAPDDCALLTSNPLNTKEGQVACALLSRRLSRTVRLTLHLPYDARSPAPILNWGTVIRCRTRRR
jgi:hypothetical protein